MRFLLDTDTISLALRGQGRVAEQLLKHQPSDVGVSAISVAELRFGAHKRGSVALHRLIDQVLSSIEQLPFDGAAAERYGQIAGDLVRRGETLGMADAMIAAHAIELGLVLVTHNTRHFDRIEGLEWVDWY